ncbi:hypothetical protein CERZMDRAFT_108334 [Cercospora zeae-maydis SCOH1-5]|uniref:Peptidase S53 domain-containing protein n=1 Tax=Cercospora zeae-maydis SCOH1-5 TaxID=717836 RepID=A0A6A6FW96_9PEZI|nr:hypothetical protein CERZMDRAFT_108334 [Cercospora zeae-maydis SCOH1-5]
MRNTLLLTAFVASCLSSPLSGTGAVYVVHERKSIRLHDWSRIERRYAAFTIPLRIALAQANLDQAEDWLLQTSHPASSKYGQHWSPQDVAAAFAPRDGTAQAVIDWLSSAGIAPERIQQSRSWGWLHVDATIDEAERLLQTEYHVYEHQSTGQLHVACEQYSIPADLRRHVDFITPTVHFDTSGRAYAALSTAHGVPSGGELAHCDKRFPDGSGANPKNSLGIIELTPAAFRPADLDLFFANFSPSQVGERPIFESIQGGVNQQTLDRKTLNAESNQNLAWSMTLVHPQQVTLLQVGDLVQGGSANSFLDAVDASYCTYEGGDGKTISFRYKGKDCGIYAPTKVVSASYYWDESYFGPAYMRRQCNEYLKLGLMGVTILFASGDEGVAGGGGKCTHGSAGEQGNKTVGGRFAPSFPGISGGGFSDVFSLPSYQADAVQSYFANFMPPYTADRYNNSQQARGYPDLSANGAHYALALHGNWTEIYGTSCATPTMASILTLINEARYNAGKTSIGFINPVIYGNPQIFNDVTEGHNPGCNTSGFAAVPGWDPLTGMGTPVFPKMLEVFMALP